jgi:hypothetical protein
MFGFLTKSSEDDDFVRGFSLNRGKCIVDSSNFAWKLPRIFHYNIKERNRMHPTQIAKKLFRLK